MFRICISTSKKTLTLVTLILCFNLWGNTDSMEKANLHNEQLLLECKMESDSILKGFNEENRWPRTHKSTTIIVFDQKIVYSVLSIFMLIIGYIVYRMTKKIK